MELLRQFRGRISQLGLVRNLSEEETQQLRDNYTAALQNLLENLNPPSLNPFKIKTSITDMGGSYKGGKMRLGVCPQEINFPTITYFHLGLICGKKGDISEGNLANGASMFLTGATKKYLPSDIDLTLQRTCLWAKWNPVLSGWKDMDGAVYRALKKTYDRHGVFINAFPDEEAEEDSL